MSSESTFLKYHKMPLLFMALSSVLYLSFAYDLVRTDITKLILLYIALFAFAFQLKKIAGFNFSILALSAILFRFLFINAIPNLSQDFYRFIWDGRMIFEGFNPYLYTPDSFINNGQFPVHEAQELYNGMGSLSSGHFTNYPPLNQLCFFIAALFGGKSIMSAAIVMRLIIISADIGTLYFGKKLLERLRLPSSRIWWYILNPFIIIELTGNLHFEGVMVFFLVWSLYLLHKGYFKWAAVVLACSISVKLIPLMFLPVFFWWFLSKSNTVKGGLLNLIIFYSIVGATILALFLPFFSMEFINNYSKTVGLWFGNFEFNASIYYLAREIGYAITGYNEIAIIGKILPVISLICILSFSFFRKNKELTTLTSSLVLAFGIYLFLSTTVHPWYIATLLVLSLFTNYRFPLIWSVVIILSYLAYSNSSNSENLWIIALEYIIVFSAFIWEVFLKKKIKI
ncbi:glycosyltransferase family 58 protein [Winogradskyella immobilis]|uniref:Mannosyltransferase n=1 Tax=Winogradskyella immobilis TaxID=2816852 RepID=A0ABS8EJU2_9FLAO|nr:mannosyltransferase [Winogradskyella immobilis]MCC1483127.1 mannosyltransferase [Winogradskyella immobilis]MCG0015222.1 mannosyltransferase [Winogradskyella immobilis]